MKSVAFYDSYCKNGLKKSYINHFLMYTVHRLHFTRIIQICFSKGKYNGKRYQVEYTPTRHSYGEVEMWDYERRKWGKRGGLMVEGDVEKAVCQMFVSILQTGKPKTAH